MGWYMYAVASAETTLLVAGFVAAIPERWRLWGLLIVTISVAAADLYSVHLVSIPYHTGFTAHLQNHSVSSFHVGRIREIGLSEVVQRLGVNKPRWMTASALLAAWGAYVLATLVLTSLPFAIRGQIRTSAD